MQARAPYLSEHTKAALYRLEKTLDEENAALAAFETCSLRDFSRIKTQTLLELQRSAAMLTQEQIPLDISRFLMTLRKKLELNRWLLLLHLEAAREVTGVITSAIRETESDGTYSRVSGKLRVQS
jgi:hypothetical protein